MNQKEKEMMIVDYLNQIQDSLWKISDQIYDLSEVGLQEVQSAALLENYLEEQGFAVERGVGGLDTAFRAVYEQGQGGRPLDFWQSTMPWRPSAMAAATICRGPA